MTSPPLGRTRAWLTAAEVRIPKLNLSGSPPHLQASLPLQTPQGEGFGGLLLVIHPAPLQAAGAHLSVTHYDQADKSDVHVGPQRFIVVNLIHLQGERYKGSKFP